MGIREPIEFRRQQPRPRPTVVANARCSYAEGFATYCEALLARLDAVAPGNLDVGYAQAKIQLIDRYCDYLSDTPVRHTNPAGRRVHPCLTDVLNHTVREIRQRQRVALPDKLAVPPKPPRAVAPRQDPPQIAGILIGKKVPDGTS